MKEVLFEAFDSDYEEGWHLEIFEEDGKIYVRTEGHSVMVGDFDSTDEISSEQALEIALEHAEYEDTDYLGWDYNNPSVCPVA
jgi:hypothetical protein